MVQTILQFLRSILDALAGIYITDYVTVPGIAAADAFDAGDVLGAMFSFPAPEAGFIQGARLIDQDDDTLSLTVHIFTAVHTTAASDAALDVSDEDALNWVTSIALTSTTDLGSAKVAEVMGWNSGYYAPNKRLYAHCSTAGTPTIAAGKSPRIQLVIIPARRAAV